MKPQKGYHSLIQFCPDASRLEAVNLGVVLFCPALDFLASRTSSSTRRAEKLVGRGELAREALKLARTAIEQRLRTDRASFRDIEDMQRFVETRGNSLRLTDPRPLKVYTPADDLNRLFDELVGGPAASDRNSVARDFPSLQSLFARLSDEGRAELDFSAQLPVLGQEFRVPFAYRNGVLNLVKPQRFSYNARQQALNLAIRGDLIHRHGIQDAPNPRLVVVSRFPADCDAGLISHVDELFGEYSVKHIHDTDIDAFANQIEIEAHA